MTTSPDDSGGLATPSSVGHRRLSGKDRFVDIADRVSYFMGTPANILAWLVLVGAWFAFGPYIARHDLLPTWFTSNNFNFPLNTVTTIAELYIGFLVGASTNRTERHNREQADRMEGLEKLIHQELQRNTETTTDAHAMAQEIKAQVPVVKDTLAYVERLLATIDPTFRANAPEPSGPVPNGQ